MNFLKAHWRAGRNVEYKPSLLIFVAIHIFSFRKS